VRAHLLIIAVAAAVTFAATFWTLKLSRKHAIMPEIRERDVHTDPTPRIGGLAMLVGFLVSLAVASSLGWFRSVFDDPIHILAIAAAATLIAVVGFLDDIFDLDWTIKLAGQFLGAGILAWQGVQIVSLPIGGLVIGSYGISIVVTIFVTVMVMNAVNFIDGLDGLVAGVVLIGTSVFFLYTYLLVQQTSPTNYFNLASLISAIVIGVTLGFLPLNWHKAKIFMGDSGAMLLGLLMATSALAVTGQVDPAAVSSEVLAPAFLPLVLPFAILLLPLLDLTLAVLRRIRSGKSPFSADRKHIHHRLQDFGHSHIGSVVVFYIWTLLISLSALALLFLSEELVLWLSLLFAIPVLTYTVWPLIQQRRKAKI
jgi:UDP-GlcNAc:undecaprenyl-phosphate/decaprenyl-phosphate GlcNAc-1-phosphate transferase